MKLRIPGKTFLVGEYAVLVGGKALGLATQPYFASMTEEMTPHPESAAGLFLHGEKGSALHNPYGVGGFGQSTAEFIAAWFEQDQVNDLSIMFRAYRNLFAETPPSGADLVIQMLGQVTYFNPEIRKSKAFAWPFKDLGFDILSTGLKIPTHEHLKSLDLKNLNDLPELAEEVIENFDEDQKFISSLTAWSEKLKTKGLQHKNSTRLLKELEKNSKIILAKPNGALGADTITVFYSRADQNSVRENLNLKILADHTSLARGAHYVD